MKGAKVKNRGVMKEELITMKESAKLLKLNKNALLELIKFKKFKTFKKGNTIKLSRIELREWLSNMIEEEQVDLAVRRVVCRFTDFFSKKNIFLNLEAKNKYDAIAEMAAKAKELKIITNNRWLYEAIIAREEIVSTAVGRGVAFLHTRALHPSKVKKPNILFARSKVGIDFDSVDGRPVDLFFMMLLRDERQHLFSLSYINSFMLNSENVDLLRTSKTSDDVFEILTHPKNIS